MRKRVHHLFHLFRPLGWGFGVVETLPGDRLSKGDGKALATLFEHFVGKQEHFKVEFQTDQLPEIREPVKEPGVSATHENRNDIPLVLDRFLYKMLVPFELAVNPPL